MLIGKIDDTFIFTRRDDVITWSKEDGRERHDTGLDHIDDIRAWSDGLLIVGDGDEILRFDVEDGISTLYDGPLDSSYYPLTICTNDVLSHHGAAAIHELGLAVKESWSVYGLE